MAKPTTPRTRKPTSKPAPAPAAANAPAASPAAAADPAEPAAPAVTVTTATPPAPQQAEPPQPPEAVQGQGVIVVTGPRKGFRRGGLDFGATPVVLDPAEFASDGSAGPRLLAILTEPRLTCVVRMDDGSEAPVAPELIGALRAAIAAADEGDDA